MPEEQWWETFFDPAEALAKLGLDPAAGDVVDFGCGYGTFSLPAARITPGTVHALDIDPLCVERTRTRASAEGLTNVNAMVRDFVSNGTGLPPASAGYCMLFNILHAENPQLLLREARRVLTPGGRLAVMHWRHDPSTPRGPTMAIRPKPEQCAAWAETAGFTVAGPGVIDLPPYHYGLMSFKT
jgi:SAM-dependent methyltransferase